MYKCKCNNYYCPQHILQRNIIVILIFKKPAKEMLKK